MVAQLFHQIAIASVLVLVLALQVYIKQHPQPYTHHLPLFIYAMTSKYQWCYVFKTQVTTAKFPDHQDAHFCENLGNCAEGIAGPSHRASPARKVAGACRPGKRQHRASLARIASEIDENPADTESDSTDPEIQRVAAQKCKLAQMEQQKGQSPDPPIPSPAVAPGDTSSGNDDPPNPAPEPIQADSPIPDAASPDNPIPDAAPPNNPVPPPNNPVPPPHQPYVEDADDDDDDAPTPPGSPPGSSSSSENGSDNPDVEEIVNQLREHVLREVGRDLDEEELDIIRGFAWKLKFGSVPEAAFSALPGYFPNIGSETWKTTLAYAATLSGIEPIKYDCCINSCVCFYSQHAGANICSHCHEPRFDDKGKPRAQFSYLPITDRLKILYENPEMAAKMGYRSTRVPQPGKVTDIFDGNLYKELCQKHVVTQGIHQDCKYFDDHCHIALGLAADCFSPFKGSPDSAWGLILVNYNLPPEIRFLQDNIICCGIIPGPHKPKDADSFLLPLVEELLKFENGVRAHDCRDPDEYFLLCAFLIVVFGDIPAIAMLMRMKGHNALFPCQWCKIQAIRTPGGQPNDPLYVPHNCAGHPDIP